MQTKLSVFCDQIVEAGGLAAAAAVPLVFNVYSSRTFEPDKVVVLRCLVALMALAWVVAGIERCVRLKIRPAALGARVRRWIKTPLVLPVALLVLVYLISTLFSIAPRISLWGSYERLQGTYSLLCYIVLFALIAGNLRTRAQAERWVTTIILTSIPVSLYGVIQYYGLDPMPWAEEVRERVTATMGSPNFVAAYLLMLVPLTLSRLIGSIAAWMGRQVRGQALAGAAYLFAVLGQLTVIALSQSRAPALGLCGACLVMGLLLTLRLRRRHRDRTPLAAGEIALGLVAALLPAAAAAVGAAAGWLLGVGLSRLVPAGFPMAIANLPLLLAIAGATVGFPAFYAGMAVAARGWRWLWLSWVGAAVLGALFVLALNLPGTGTRLRIFRELPRIGQLVDYADDDTGSIRNRVLIWDAVLRLAAPHKPLGIAGDAVAGEDRFHRLRPLLGYGPESMLNAFPLVRPAEIGAWETSIDRAHNETLDRLVTTGWAGVAVFYLFMITLFAQLLSRLGFGWVRRRSGTLLVLGGVVGALASVWITGRLTFAALGFAMGLLSGLLVHLCRQGTLRQEAVAKPRANGPLLLLAGLAAALVGHFIEIQFSFPVAVTHTCFWIYLALFLGVARAEIGTGIPARRAAEAAAAPGDAGARDAGVRGLVVAIMLVVLTSDFLTPGFDFTSRSGVLVFGLLLLVWLPGLALLPAVNTPRRAGAAAGGAARAVGLYALASLGPAVLWVGIQRLYFAQSAWWFKAPAEAVRKTDAVANSFVLLLAAVFTLVIVLAVGSRRRQSVRGFWRRRRAWLYTPLILATALLIWFKNVDVIRADVYMRGAERFRQCRQWAEALELHEKAISLNATEDRYHLGLALTCQLMIRDRQLPPARRRAIWHRGEKSAIEARRINPYNPDNTANLGRFYVTSTVLFGRQHLADAASLFDKAVVLAPSNVMFQNSGARIFYMLQDYEGVVRRLEASLAIDCEDPATWMLLAEVYGVMGRAGEAARAHVQARRLTGGS